MRPDGLKWELERLPFESQIMVHGSRYGTGHTEVVPVPRDATWDETMEAVQLGMTRVREWFAARDAERMAA
jgi:hypothetical protein